MSSRSGQAGQSDAGQVAAQRKRKMEQMLCGCASRSTAAERAVAARLQTGATKRVAAIVLDTDGEEWNGSISRAAMQKIFKFLVGGVFFAACAPEVLVDSGSCRPPFEDPVKVEDAVNDFLQQPTVAKLRDVFGDTRLGVDVVWRIQLLEGQAKGQTKGKAKTEAKGRTKPGGEEPVAPVKKHQGGTHVEPEKGSGEGGGGAKKPTDQCQDQEARPPTRVQIFDVTALNRGMLPKVHRQSTAQQLQRATYENDRTSTLVYCRTEDGQSVHLMLEMPMSFFVHVPQNWEKSHVRSLAMALGAFKFRLEQRIRFVYYTPHLPGNTQRDRPQKIPYARFFFRTEQQARSMYWKLSSRNGRRTDDEVLQKLLRKADLNPSMVRQEKSRHVFSAHDLTDPVRDFFSEVNRKLKLTIAKDNKCSMESWLTLSKVRWLKPDIFFARSKWNAVVDLSNIVKCDNALVSAPMTKASFDIEQFSEVNPKSEARPFPKSWRITDEIRNISCAIQVGSDAIRNVALCMGATRISTQLESIDKKKKKKEKAKEEAKEEVKEEEEEEEEETVKGIRGSPGSGFTLGTSGVKPAATSSVRRGGRRANCAKPRPDAPPPGVSRRPSSAPGPSRPQSLFSQAMKHGIDSEKVSDRKRAEKDNGDDWQSEVFEGTLSPTEEEAAASQEKEEEEEEEESAAPDFGHLQPLEYSSEVANMAPASGKTGTRESGIPIVGMPESDTRMFGPGGIGQTERSLFASPHSMDDDSRTTPFPTTDRPRLHRQPSFGNLDRDLHLSAAVGAGQSREVTALKPGTGPDLKPETGAGTGAGASRPVPGPSPLECELTGNMDPRWRGFGAGAGLAASDTEAKDLPHPIMQHMSDPGPTKRARPVFMDPHASSSGAPVPEIVQYEQDMSDAVKAAAAKMEAEEQANHIFKEYGDDEEDEFELEEPEPVAVTVDEALQAQRAKETAAEAVGPIVYPGQKVKVPGTNIEIWCFEREDELLVAFGELLAEVEVDLLTGYNIINYDEMAVYQRLFLYYLCKVQSWAETEAMYRAAKTKMEKYEDIRKRNKKLTKAVRGEIADLFCLHSDDYELCKHPPLAYLILSQAQHFDKASYDYFRAGVSPLSWFYHGKIPTQQITYREQMYDTSAHGQFMMKQWVGTGYAILCGWVMMKRSTFKFPSYTLKYVLQHFFKDNEDYHKIDLDYSDMFENMETDDPDRLGTNAVYCCRDAEAVLYLIDKMGIEMNMRQNGALMRSSVQVQTDSGMQRLVLGMLQGELETDYVINNFVPRSGDYVGATVIEPKKGFYIDPVATLDYKSLYPSIMIAGNLGPSTLVEPRYDGKPCRASRGVKTRTWNVTDTYATTFVQNEKGKNHFGKIPSMLKRLLAARDAVKVHMKTAYKRGDKFQGGMLNSKQLAIKISCNSVYGFFGVKVGRGFFPINAIAATVTCWGRAIITGLTKQRIEEEKGWECIYGDSVTGDTPIFIRLRGAPGHAGTRSCSSFLAFEQTLRRLGHFPRLEAGKLVWTLGDDAGVEVWNDTGWTVLHKFIKHRTRKPIVRVKTQSGYVDCTEDHSLITRANDEISPLQARAGATRLLTSNFAALAHDLEYPELAQRYENVDKAFDAGQNIDRAAWRPHYHWRYLPSGDMSKAFLDGLVSGGFAEVREDVICFVDEHFTKCDLSTLFLMAVRNGLTPVTEFGDGHADTVLSVERVQRLEEEIDVYDLETSNHHFHVGPGNLVVHNTDSVMVLLKGLNMVEAWAEAIKLADWVTDDVLAKFKALILEAEKVSKYYLMLKKKNYASLISENPNDVNDLSLDYKGIELKRRDKTKVVKEMLKVLYIMMPEEEGADARPQTTAPVISKEIQKWLWKIIRDELDTSFYETSQTSKIKYKKARPGHMLVFDRHNERVETGAQKGLTWDAGKRVPYVVLLGEKQTRRGKKVVYGSKEVSPRMEEPEWVNHWNTTKKRKAKDKMVLDRIYYIGLCANAVIRLLPFHLPHVDEMFDFAIEQVEMQMFKMRSIGGFFGATHVMPTGMPRPSDRKPLFKTAQDEGEKGTGKAAGKGKRAEAKEDETVEIGSKYKVKKTGSRSKKQAAPVKRKRSRSKEEEEGKGKGKSKSKSKTADFKKMFKKQDDAAAARKRAKALAKAKGNAVDFKKIFKKQVDLDAERKKKKKAAAAAVHSSPAKRPRCKTAAGGPQEQKGQGQGAPNKKRSKQEPEAKAKAKAVRRKSKGPRATFARKKKPKPKTRTPGQGSISSFFGKRK